MGVAVEKIGCKLLLTKFIMHNSWGKNSQWVPVKMWDN